MISVQSSSDHDDLSEVVRALTRVGVLRGVGLHWIERLASNDAALIPLFYCCSAIECVAERSHSRQATQQAPIVTVATVLLDSPKASTAGIGCDQLRDRSAFLRE